MSFPCDRAPVMQHAHTPIPELKLLVQVVTFYPILCVYPSRPSAGAVRPRGFSRSHFRRRMPRHSQQRWCCSIPTTNILLYPRFKNSTYDLSNIGPQNSTRELIIYTAFTTNERASDLRWEPELLRRTFEVYSTRSQSDREISH